MWASTAAIGMVAMFAPLTRAAEQPAGAATCSGAFQLDGAGVTNTATVFIGSKIDSLAGVCTIRMSTGEVVKIEGHSEITIITSGVILGRGTIHIAGKSELMAASSKAVIKPGTPATILSARLLDNQLKVNVQTGNATLVGLNSELYARLDDGTLTTFTLAPGEPSGLYLGVAGCTTQQANSRVLSDPGIDRKVELLGVAEKIDKQPIGIVGAMEPLSSTETQIAARLKVVQETPSQGGCRGFTRASNLDSTTVASAKAPFAQIAAVIGAVAAQIAAVITAAAGQAGQYASSVSVP